MKSIWNGTLGFGLVNIPVNLYSASQNNALDLDMLDKRDQARIKYHKVNEHTGKEVPWEDIGKGYLINDHYVLLDEADFEHASPKKTKMIEIKEFVDEKDIDADYFEAPYFVVPEKGGAKAYALLQGALAQSKKVGISTFVLRNAENLSIIRAKDKRIMLNKIRFPSELRDADELDLPTSGEINKKELDMAIMLIDQYTTSFNPSQYKDQYTAELLSIIEEKAKGVKTKIKKLKIVHSDNSNLLAQLKASLTKSKKAS